MSFKQKREVFMYRYPKIKNILRGMMTTLKVTGTVGGVMVGLLAVLCGAGYVNDTYRKHRMKVVLRPDDRKATLIEKKDNLLFLDLDGNTNTAEVLVRTATCPTTIEAVRSARVGTVKKVSEWKGKLVDKCWEEHFEWIDMTTKEREHL